MSRELGKIAVIYSHNVPALDTGGVETPGRDLEIIFVSETKCAQFPAPWRSDISLVVYQLTDAPQLSLDQIRQSFPEAVITTCSDNPSHALPATSSEQASPQHLVEPISCAQLQALLSVKTSSAPSSIRRTPDVPPAFGGTFSEFSHTFINLVEVSTNKEEFELVFGDLTKKIARRMSAEHCILYVYSEAEGDFYPAFTKGSKDGHEPIGCHTDNALLEEVIRSGAPYINNALKGPAKDGSGGAATTRSALFYPLFKNAKRIGVLEVSNKAGHAGFGKADKAFLSQIIHTLSVIVDNAILFQNVERLCYTDDLTKLYNSRYLNQFLVTEVKRSLRYRKSVSVLFIDIDRFKGVNDAHGHLVGSETLVEIGRVLKSTVRDTDVVARYGGDEFVIVLPEITTECAVDVAERIRFRVETHPFGIKHNLPIRLTVSIGISTCADHAITSEGLIQKADIAMYKAKSLSKNSVCVAV